MYISRKLVELQGGQIFLESAKNVGTGVSDVLIVSEEAPTKLWIVFRFFVNVKIASTTDTMPTTDPTTFADLPEVDRIQSAALSFSGAGPIEKDLDKEKFEAVHVLVVEGAIKNSLRVFNWLKERPGR